MKRCLWIIGLCWLAAGASAARAQSEIELFAGGYSAGTDLSGVDFDSGGLLGFRLGQSFLRLVGTEFSYTLIPSLQDPGLNFEGRAHLLNGNLLLQIPVGRVVPFGTVGIGSIIGDSDSFLRVKTAFAWNAGAGLKLRELAGPLGLRFDVRYYRVPDGVELPSPNLREVDFDFAEFSGGLLLTF